MFTRLCVASKPLRSRPETGNESELMDSYSDALSFHSDTEIHGAAGSVSSAGSPGGMHALFLRPACIRVGLGANGQITALRPNSKRNGVRSPQRNRDSAFDRPLGHRRNGAGLDLRHDLLLIGDEARVCLSAGGKQVAR